MKFVTGILIVLALSTALSAADISGVWKATVETPNGSSAVTFTLKADGAKLTGTVDSQMGKSDISEGKIDGDNISFNVVREFNGNEFRLTYKGKVTGSEMKLTLSVPNMDQTFDITAKKAS